MSRQNFSLIDVLRSIIYLDSDIEQKKNIKDIIEENYHLLQDRKLSYGVDYVFFSIVIAFWDKYKKLPTLGTIKQILDDEKNIIGYERLKIIENDLNKATLLNASEFIYTLEQLEIKDRKDKLSNVITQALTITEQGLEVKQGNKKIKLQGIDDSVNYILTEVSGLSGGRYKTKEGDIREEANSIIEEYIQKEQTGASFGILTDFTFLDGLTSGIQYGEMFTVAGFTGHGKTTFCLNAFYNSVFYYGNTGAYFSLEMPRKQIMRILSTIHSGNRKFRDIHPPILYSNLKDGKLTESERDFYLNVVMPDFESNVEAGKMLIFQPDDATSVALIRSKLESYHTIGKDETGIDFVVVDHPGLMIPRHRTGNPYEDMNQILRDLKQLALTFSNNRGTAVWVPYQINRSGWREAMENKGVYKIDCLAQASEAERSSDIIIALYLDGVLREDNELLITFLKARDADLPTKTIKLATALKSRLVMDYIETVYSQDVLLEIIPT